MSKIGDRRYVLFAGRDEDVLEIVFANRTVYSLQFVFCVPAGSMPASWGESSGSIRVIFAGQCGAAFPHKGLQQCASTASRPPLRRMRAE